MGHYVLGDLLGHGSMAEVFAGFALGDHGYQKPVALKRLLPELASNRVFVERLTEKAKLLVDLQHRNIVSVLDLARDASDVFLVMEFVDGPNLRELLGLRGARGLPLGLATYVVQSAAVALEFAHRRPGGATLHADLSPSNLLLTTSGEVRVADFGLARREGGGPGIIEVKSPYMAPEQARGEALTPRADVFALGVVLYELICGKHPFGAQATLEQRDSDPMPVIPPRAVKPRIPAGLDAICMRALAHDPRERYQSMQELIDALVEERSRNQLREDASDLAQLIGECSPHPVPRHPSTMMTGQSVTMTMRSLLRDPTPARRSLTTPPPVKTPPSHGPRPPAPAPGPAQAASAPTSNVPPILDSVARAAIMVTDARARELLEVPPISRLATGTPPPITAPVVPAEPVLSTAPARTVVATEPVMPAGKYTVSAAGSPMLGAPVGPQPARSRRSWIPMLAAAAVTGAISAAGFHFLAGEVQPTVAAPTPAAPTPTVAAPTPPATAPTPVTAQTMPDTLTPGIVRPTFPDEPLVPENPPETPGETPDEPTTTTRKKAPGTLRVQTTPWAWVTIGKQKQKTPDAEFTLAPGRYTVRLEFPTLGITETKKVAIESKKTFTLNIDNDEGTGDKDEGAGDKDEAAGGKDEAAGDKDEAAGDNDVAAGDKDGAAAE